MAAKGEMRVARCESGLSLVEAMIAIFVLAVALLALLSTASQSLLSLTTSQLRQQAYTAASRSIEVARTLEFSELFLLDPPESSAVAGAEVDPSTGSPSAPGVGEELRRHADPGRAALEMDPHQLDSDFTLRTFVSIPDDGWLGDELIQVRVTAVAEFVRQGRVEVVRQSTLISRDDRVLYGLDQPAFSVSPAVRGIEMDRDRPRCVEHRVRNQGASADYWFEKQSHVENHQLDTDYDLTVSFVAPDGSVSAWQDGAEHKMSVGIDQSFDIRLCYDARAGAASLAEAMFRVVSDIAPEEGPHSGEPEEPGATSQQFFHSIVIETERHLYLSFPDDLSAPAALVPDSPDGVALQSIGDADRPGITLTPGGSADWETTFEGPRTIESASLMVWTSSPNALEDGAALPSQQDLTVRLVHHSETAPSETLHESSRSVDTDQEGWSIQTWDLPLTPTQIDTGDRIALSLTCEDSSDEACSVAVGSGDHPARLEMAFP